MEGRLTLKYKNSNHLKPDGTGKPNSWCRYRTDARERSVYVQDIDACSSSSAFGRMAASTRTVSADWLESKGSYRFRPDHGRRLLAGLRWELYPYRQLWNDVPAKGRYVETQRT